MDPGYDVDTEGEGDILRVTRKPQAGDRAVTMDDDKTVPQQYRMIVDESMDQLSALLHGRAVRLPPQEVALTFDDGPDPSGRRRSSTS